MSQTLYKVINPIVQFILGSRFHRLMSRNTVLLEFKGRKSGKAYSTPISYHETGGQIHCFTDKNSKWWHNLRHGDEVTLTLRGRKQVGKPTVRIEASPEKQKALHDFLVATPRDASHAGVGFDKSGQPDLSDLAEASKQLIFISIEVGHEPSTRL